MTIIFGIHLTKKLYLVSDTRLSVKQRDGSVKYFDDIIKVVEINSRIAVAVAGNAKMASYLLKRIKGIIRDNSSASYIQYIANNELEGFVRDYVNETGEYGKVGLIFTGFNLNRPKIIDSSLLGAALSAPAMANEGQRRNLSIEPAVLEALDAETAKNNGLSANSKIRIPKLPQTEMFAIKVLVTQAGIKIDSEIIDTYQYAIFHPNSDVEKIDIPVNLLSEVDFRPLPPNVSGEEVLYEDARILSAFLHDLVIKRSFSSVGGNIFVTRVTQYGIAFPTGTIGKITNGQLTIWRLYVENNELCYELPNGTKGKYKNLENFSIQSGMDI